MTVQDLIEVLEQMDPTATVVLASDPEGNNFAPVEDYGTGVFNSKTDEFHSDEEVDFNEPDADEEETDEPNGSAAIVLWPAY